MKLLLAFAFLLNLSFAKAEVEMDEFFDESLVTLTEGMSEKEKEVFLKHAQEAQKLMKEMQSKSPEELKKIIAEAENAGKGKDFQKELEKMSDEEKAVFRKTMENLNKFKESKGR